MNQNGLIPFVLRNAGDTETMVFQEKVFLYETDVVVKKLF